MHFLGLSCICGYVNFKLADAMRWEFTAAICPFSVRRRSKLRSTDCSIQSDNVLSTDRNGWSWIMARTAKLMLFALTNDPIRHGCVLIPRNQICNLNMACSLTSSLCILVIFYLLQSFKITLEMIIFNQNVIHHSIHFPIISLAIINLNRQAINVPQVRLLGWLKICIELKF